MPDSPTDSEVGEDVDFTLDDVGTWSIRKNDIVEYYASVYSEITKSSKAQFTRYYIDGFANRGLSRLKGTREIVLGSALRVLSIAEPFDKCVFVEQDEERMKDLRRNVGDRSDVEFIEGDANVVLPSSIFPRVRYDHYERALCFLDPYNMSGLRWDTIAAAGSNDAIEAIVHFPTMDAHRTVLLANQGDIRPRMRAKINAYWGDESWLEGAYSSEGMLPMANLLPRKRESKAVIEAFRNRLRDGAKFPFVSKGFPMRNSAGNIVYHLLFASHNQAAQRVMRALEKRFIEPRDS